MLPGRDIVVVVRTAAVTAPYSRLEREFARLCKKNGLMKK